jgi:Antibiotic biosynthesis monooxygenase
MFTFPSEMPEISGRRPAPYRRLGWPKGIGKKFFLTGSNWPRHSSQWQGSSSAAGADLSRGRDTRCQDKERTAMRVINTGTSRRTFVSASLASGLALVMQPVLAQSQNRRLPMEVTIRANSGVMTLINVFTVDPENQQQLVELLKAGTESLMSKMTGYISASFHIRRHDR